MANVYYPQYDPHSLYAKQASMQKYANPLMLSYLMQNNPTLRAQYESASDVGKALMDPIGTATANIGTSVNKIRNAKGFTNTIKALFGFGDTTQKGIPATRLFASNSSYPQDARLNATPLFMR